MSRWCLNTHINAHINAHMDRGVSFDMTSKFILHMGYFLFIFTTVSTTYLVKQKWQQQNYTLHMYGIYVSNIANNKSQFRTCKATQCIPWWYETLTHRDHIQQILLDMYNTYCRIRTTQLLMHPSWIFLLIHKPRGPFRYAVLSEDFPHTGECCHNAVKFVTI